MAAIHLFTYGSLMFPNVWSEVARGHYETIEGRVYGFQRRRIRNETFPALIPGTPHDFVDGIVYCNLSLDDLKRLDEFEGDYYVRRSVECNLLNGTLIKAQAYLFKEEFFHLIEMKEWDPQWFSENGILSFLKQGEFS